MTDTKSQMAKEMGKLPEDGFDVVIVCCSGVIEANYWQQRLESSKGVILPNKTTVLSVDEDWNGGAGNGLGTLYAYHKAVTAAKAKELDLNRELNKGSTSIAIYHTAGKGTRLAPLPGAENNNKPGVKLPSTVQISNGNTVPMTILEAVIKQTAVYAPSRKGRVSVFWGDQIFIPSVSPVYDATCHIDLLSQMLKEMPTEEVWKEKGLASYGLAVQFESGSAAQIEKVDHPTAVRMLEGLGKLESVGPSLGSFSVSSAMLSCLMSEFGPELEQRTGQLDTDPHFWMPLTLPKDAYNEIMSKKGTSLDVSSKQWDRMRKMLFKNEDILNLSKGKKLFGPVDCGEDAYWWDYGQLAFYNTNNMRLISDGVENDAYRTFFNVERGVPKDSTVTCKLDDQSTVASSTLKEGSVLKSALCNVTAGYIEASGCILVNVTAKKIIASPGTIAYNIVDDSDEGLILTEGKVITTVFSEDGSQTRMTANMKVTEKDAWTTVLDGNKFSYEQIHKMNKGVDPIKCEQQQRSAHDALIQSISAKSR
eukprot:TRINITY_DN12139_c0_g2_i1.p1 TRINITY_DN12139_c0_g2~~TRINITY_DN12139_c0_g2_i1.p1  ORF type:complete len:553 (+),score=133.35 TRINITY_DN12139_c0_g2_i1:55-1659(+)